MDSIKNQAPPQDEQPDNQSCRRNFSLRNWPWWLLPVAGFLALLWFLVRVIPKPSRATYPCQRAAIPLASIFAVWALGALVGLFAGWGKAKRTTRIIIVIVLAVVSAVVCLHLFSQVPLLPSPIITDPANEPIGVAKGIHPGRVVWVHDPEATDWEFKPKTIPWEEHDLKDVGYWWEAKHTNQAAVDQMMSQAIVSLTSENTDAAAWNALFRHFNAGRSNSAYQKGEKIVIKLNLANMSYLNLKWVPNFVDPNGNQTATQYLVNTSPQMTLALLRQLVNVVGVEQKDITVGDRTAFFPNHYWDYLHGEFPDVHYLSYVDDLGRTKATASDVPFYWSTDDADGKKQDFLPACYVEARYLINFAMLKGHSSGITVCGKNNYGSFMRMPNPKYLNEGDYYNLHLSLPNNRIKFDPPWSPGRGHYRAIVDIMGHRHLGGKTLLYLVDGLYGGYYAEGYSRKWLSAPFGDGQTGDWPSSLFASQDPVAIDSVCHDFLLEEWPDVVTGGWTVKGSLKGGEQDYLHEAALADHPPSGTFYDPERDRQGMESLGVHEHWNNPTDKQYSRDLGTGDGIELIKIKSNVLEKEKVNDKTKDKTDPVKIDAVTTATRRVVKYGSEKSEKESSDTAGTEHLVAPGAELVEVYADENVLFEGPCWDRRSEKLYFVAWGKRKQVLTLDGRGKVTVWIDDPNNQIGVNGLFSSREDILLTAQVYAHQVVSYATGSDRAEEKNILAHNEKWNQPNDICQSPSGNLYFSDPQWGGDHSNSAVYCLSRSGKVSRVIDDMPGPNGLIVSNDGKTLYVADSIEKNWRSYPILGDGTLDKGEVFFEPEKIEPWGKSDLPDGMTIDERGNVYLTGLGGVRIISPAGKFLTAIAVPEKVSNVTFGGGDNKTLFVTCKGKVYRLQMLVGGV